MATKRIRDPSVGFVNEGGTTMGKWTIRIGVNAAALTALLVSAAAVGAQEMQTIRPGMSEIDVKAVFGNPDGQSSRASFIFYFYRNGCEPECGWPDVVFFQNGQVVDAILRATWRDYAGESSSPKGVVPRAGAGGERLQMPADVESIQVRPTPSQMPADVESIQVRPTPSQVPPVQLPVDSTPPPEAEDSTPPPGG